MRTWGCICKEGFVWSEIYNHFTNEYDYVCVPDDRCLDNKVCRSDEYFVPRKGSIYFENLKMQGCYSDKSEYYTGYNPEKANIATKQDVLMAQSNQLKVGIIMIQWLIQWLIRLVLDRQQLHHQHVSVLET